MRHAVIMAGGSGTRLWPLSRRRRPKQLLRLFEGKSLLRLAFERLVGLLPPENILVVTGSGHLDAVAGELPELPENNLIGEPYVRDTANAVGLAAVLLEERDRDGIMGIFTADHVIRPVQRFQVVVASSFEAAAQHSDALITLGVPPRSPHTGYGYVHRGPALGAGLFESAGFTEKPDLDTARRYVESGAYYWNSGMFVWRIQTILEQLRRHLPESFEKLMRVSKAPAGLQRQEAIREIYPTLLRISIDYGVMEKAPRVLIRELDCEWLDVGEWTAMADVLGADADNQVLAHPQIVTLDARGNIIVGEGDHLIAAIGVEDLVIVRSADATLVCHKDHVQQIKHLVERLDERYL